MCVIATVNVYADRGFVKMSSKVI